MSFPVWTPATHDSGGATPGARALMAWALDTFPAARNGGIYNYRPVRGGTALSLHAEGRACDVMFALIDGKPDPSGLRLALALRTHAKALGVQAIIHDRRIWSARSPGVAGRAYRGVNPHRDHVHVELTRTSAAKLTKATIRHVVPPLVSSQGRPTLHSGDHGPAVKALQRLLGGLVIDGSFGKATLAALNALKRRHGLPEDGVAGERVWAILDGRRP